LLSVNTRPNAGFSVSVLHREKTLKGFESDVSSGRFRAWKDRVYTDINRRIRAYSLVLQVKKLINDPSKVTDEMVEGMALAFPNLIRKLEGLNVVVRRDAPVKGKVGIIAGGGSGHEPFWLGYTGKGFVDGTVVGDVFSSPTPRPVYEATKTVNGGVGVVYILGNYSGDKMNFGIAMEMAKAEGIDVEICQVTDDIASALRGNEDKRRGIAGNVLVLKIAGARAEEMASLDEVKSIAQEANRNIRTMGVAIAPCTIPATQRVQFVLEEDKMELGMGIHGEPGVERTKLKTADEITDILTENILQDLPFRTGDEVAAMVNGLGATPLMELFIIHRRLVKILDKSNIKIHRSFVGNYSTSLDMAGVSLTLLRLDEDMERLLDAPASTPYFVQC
jgi:dihydroxyacetone kinase-like protein